MYAGLWLQRGLFLSPALDPCQNFYVQSALLDIAAKTFSFWVDDKKKLL